MLVCSYDHIAASSSHKSWYFVSFKSNLPWRMIWQQDGGLLFFAPFRREGSFDSMRNAGSALQEKDQPLFGHLGTQTSQ